MSTFGEHIRDYTDTDIPMIFPRTDIPPAVYLPETHIPRNPVQDRESDVPKTLMSHISATKKSNNINNDNDTDESNNDNENDNDDSYRDSKCNSAHSSSVGNNLTSPSYSPSASLIHLKSKIDEEKNVPRMDSWNLPGPRSMVPPSLVPIITSAYALSSGIRANSQHSPHVNVACNVDDVLDSGIGIVPLGHLVALMRDTSHVGETIADTARTGQISIESVGTDDHCPQLNMVGDVHVDNIVRIGHHVSPSPSSFPFNSPLLTPTTEAILSVMNANFSEKESNSDSIRNIEKCNGHNYNMSSKDAEESRHQYENREIIDRCGNIYINSTLPETPPTGESMSVSFSPFLTFTPEREITLPGISSRSDTGFSIGSTLQQNLEINKGRGRSRSRNTDVEKNGWWGE